MHVADPIGVRGQMKKQRGGNVVRQVAHQAHPGGKAAEVVFERIGAMHGQLVGRKARRKRRR